MERGAAGRPRAHQSTPVSQGKEADESSVALFKGEGSWPQLVSIQSEDTLKSRTPLNPWAVSRAGGSECLHFIFGPREKAWLLSVGKGRGGESRWEQGGEQYL